MKTYQISWWITFSLFSAKVPLADHIQLFINWSSWIPFHTACSIVPFQFVKWSVARDTPCLICRKKTMARCERFCNSASPTKHIKKTNLFSSISSSSKVVNWNWLCRTLRKKYHFLKKVARSVMKLTHFEIKRERAHFPLGYGKLHQFIWHKLNWIAIVWEISWIFVLWQRPKCRINKTSNTNS